MRDLNQIILIGRLGDDVKLHRFDNGNCTGRATLATNYDYQKQSGETVKETEWHNLLFRNKQAETVEKYTRKGAKLFVQGRIKYRSYQDTAGATRYYTEIEVQEFQFLDAAPEGNKPPSPAPVHDQTPTVRKEEEKDDLPF